MITSYKIFEWFHLRNSWDTFPINIVYHSGTIQRGDKIDINHSGSRGENQFGKGFYVSTSREVARHHGRLGVSEFRIKGYGNGLISWTEHIPIHFGDKLEKLIVDRYKSELKDIGPPYHDAVGFSGVVGYWCFETVYKRMCEYLDEDESNSLLREVGIDGWWYTPIINGRLLKHEFDFVIINPDILEWVHEPEKSKEIA